MSAERNGPRWINYRTFIREVVIDQRRALELALQVASGELQVRRPQEADWNEIAKLVERGDLNSYHQWALLIGHVPWIRRTLKNDPGQAVRMFVSTEKMLFGKSPFSTMDYRPRFVTTSIGGLAEQFASNPALSRLMRIVSDTPIELFQ
ncbi:hypothetical protein HYS91_04895 [Candidatus Daviesbacteria bacterium]|nr:hypothetical protein [Candidatus Daviesbacteria bacterium]